MTLKQALRDGWAVRIWPHDEGYTVVFWAPGQDERIGRGETVKKAVKKAFR